MFDPTIANVLDELYPRAGEKHGDWDRVVADASSRRRLRLFRTRSLRGRIVLALAVVAALSVLTVVPALAVSKNWWSLGPSAPNPTSPVVVAINPRIDDSWALVAYMSSDIVCYSLTPFGVSTFDATGGCGTGELGEPNLPEPGATYLTTAGFAVGPATLDVATVEAELGDGSTVQATITTAPKALGAPLRFYVAEFPATVKLTQIIGKDSEGRVIGTISVPDFSAMSRRSTH